MTDSNLDRLSRSLASTTSRRQALKLVGGSLIGGAALATGLRVQDTAAQTGGTLSFPINFVSGASSFIGNFVVSEFRVRNGQVQAVGRLVGTLTTAAGSTLIDQALTLPVLGSTTGTCQILHLELGPLDLTLLGLRIQLNRVVLDITAQQGGGLLGDLLCAIADLLNGNGRALGRLRNLLNQLLGALA